jgi:hypothetical protein
LDRHKFDRHPFDLFAEKINLKKKSDVGKESVIFNSFGHYFESEAKLMQM